MVCVFACGIIIEALVCVVVMELLAALYFTVFNSDTYVPFVCGLIVTALYAVIRCKRSYAVRIIRSCTYIGLASLALTVIFFSNIRACGFYSARLFRC